MPPKLVWDKHRVREKVLNLYLEGGKSLAAIASHPEVQRSRATVQSIIKTFKNRETFLDKKRSGRPPRLGKRCVCTSFLCATTSF